MGYRSKNASLNALRRKVVSTKVVKQDNLFKTLDSLQNFARENKELTELNEKISEGTLGTAVLKSVTDSRQIGRDRKREQYDTWKTNFDRLVQKNKYTNVFFPEFDDWDLKGTKASINNKKMSRTDMSFENDPEKINILMQMMTMGE
jgi:hypothetical protein